MLKKLMSLLNSKDKMHKLLTAAIDVKAIIFTDDPKLTPVYEGEPTHVLWTRDDDQAFHDVARSWFRLDRRMLDFDCGEERISNWRRRFWCRHRETIN